MKRAQGLMFDRPRLRRDGSGSGLYETGRGDPVRMLVLEKVNERLAR